MKHRLMKLLAWSNSSHEARLTAVLLVAWVASQLLSLRRYGDPPNPFIGVGVVVELLFFGAVFVGFLRRSIEEAHARRLARVLVLLGVPWGLVMVLGAGGEAVGGVVSGSMPLVLPDAPFGYIDHPTVLGLGLMAAIGLVEVLAASLAFRHEGVAGSLLIGCFALWLLEPLDSILRGAFSLPELLYGMFCFGLPPLGAGTLLLMLWRRARSHSPIARPGIA